MQHRPERFSAPSRGKHRLIALFGILAVAATGLTGLTQTASATVMTYSTPVIHCYNASGNIVASGILGSGDILTINYDDCQGFTLNSTAFASSSVTLPYSQNGQNLEVLTLTTYNGTTVPLATITNGTKTFTVVQGAGTAPTFISASPPAGNVGTAYSYTFTATGTPTPTFSVSGTLPPGLNFNATSRVRSGIPTTTGSFTPTFQASNGVGSPATASPTIVITSVPEVAKVTICHRTRATTNPYVMITVSVSSVVSTSDSLNGHADHNTTRTNKVNPTNNTSAGSGPFVVSGFNYPANKKWWGDIIPPFKHAGGMYAGLNWSSNWANPTATAQSGSAGYWITDTNFADAITSNTADVYDTAVRACVNVSTKTPSNQSAAIATPTAFYKTNVDNGADPADVKQDLREQDPAEPTQPNVDAIAAAYQATVTTETPTNVSQTAGTLNGTLNALTGGTPPTWSSSYFNYYSGTNNPTSTTPTSATGSSALSRSVTLSGLTCGTTYTYQIVGLDSVGATYFGEWKSFTTSACTDGGGTTPTPNVTPTPTPIPSVTATSTPAPPSRYRNPATLPSSPPTSPTPSPSATRNANRNAETPIVLNPINFIPVPPGETLEPETARLVDPETGKPATQVQDDAGTWTVNQPSGSVTFVPAPGFVGTATLSIQLNGRSGKLYIQPMSVRVSARSRIAVITGDVPGSISAGVVTVPKYRR